jgi:hypothetical protein
MKMLIAIIIIIITDNKSKPFLGPGLKFIVGSPFIKMTYVLATLQST